MDFLKVVILSMLKIFIFLAAGLAVTLYVLQPIYEMKGIVYTGNVWVIWFGLSYILYAAVTFYDFWFHKTKRDKLHSFWFWIAFIAAWFIILIPFQKGEIPF